MVSILYLKHKLISFMPILICFNVILLSLVRKFTARVLYKTFPWHHIDESLVTVYFAVQTLITRKRLDGVPSRHAVTTCLCLHDASNGQVSIVCEFDMTSSGAQFVTWALARCTLWRVSRCLEKSALVQSVLKRFRSVWFDLLSWRERAYKRKS